MAKNLAEQLAGLLSLDRENIKGALPPETRAGLNPKIYEASVQRGKQLAEKGVPVEDQAAYDAALEVVRGDDEVGVYDAEAAGAKQSPAPGQYGFDKEQLTQANAAIEQLGQPAEVPGSLTAQFGKPEVIDLAFSMKGLRYSGKPKPVASSGGVHKDRPDNPGNNNAEAYS